LPGYSGPVPPGGWHQQPTGAAGARPAGEGNTVAIVALILGVLGILITLVTVGILGIVGVLLGIPAIVLGVMGRRRVKSGQTAQLGGVATGGLVTGIVAVVLGLLAIVLFAIGIALLSSTPDFQEEIERQQRQLQEP
jgi:hypothetical protein